MQHRNTFSASAFVGTAWWLKYPLTTCPSHLPITAIGRCMLRRKTSLIFPSFARMRSLRVFRLMANFPVWLLPLMNVNPKKLKVSGLPSPFFSRLDRCEAAKLDQSGFVRVEG